MKRVADVLPRDSKRQKLDGSSATIFDDPALLIDPGDLLNGTDGSGYMLGKVYMTWPPRPPTKYRIILEASGVATGGGVKRFEVEFSGHCADVFRKTQLQFKLAQELYLSLKGAELVQKKQGNSAANIIPIVLKYVKGVVLEILPKGQEPGRKVDTWFKPPRPETPPPTEDDWFQTPKKTAPPVLAIIKGDLMDVIEEVSPASLPISSDTNGVSRPSIAPLKYSENPSHLANPLNSIGNSLPTATPPRQPTPMPPTASPSSSRNSRPIAPVLPNSGISIPKENPPNHRLAMTEHVSTIPAKSARPVSSIRTSASTSKLEDCKSATIEALQSADRSSPSGSALPNRSHNSDVSSASTAEPRNSTSSKPTTKAVEPVLNKNQRKNKIRREKRKAKEALAPRSGISEIPETAATPNARPPQQSASTHFGPPLLPTLSPAAQSSTLKSQPQIPQQPQSPSLHPSASTINVRSVSVVTRPRLQLPPGFTSLAVLKCEEKRNIPYSVIGVVTSATCITRTKKDDLTCSLRIVDPSNCIESFPPSYEGFTVNCFTKKYEQWLPAAAVGDIIILHKIKTSIFGDVKGVGYHDTMQWAVYKPTTGNVEHGDLTDVPKSERLGDGFGALVSPFFKAIDIHSAYCLQLDDWWRGVEEKRRVEMGTIHQIGGGSLRGPPRLQRQHRLIADTSPTSEPNGYFDCTVEVYYGHKNDSGPYSLYVTDYTALTGAYPCQANWCPATLADYILRIELWDAALELAPTMLAGEFYLLKNVRMKMSGGGYLEAKLSEAKIQKLKPDDEEKFPHFKALLERKKAHGSVDEILDSPLKLIGLGRDREYLSCVVELLHIEKPKRVIYVTDYTSHPQLAKTNGPWPSDLNGFVLKVLLDDHQATMTDLLVVGNYYTVLNLRLQQSVTAEEFRGTLGGSGRLIHPVNPKSSSVEVWKQGLIERKNELPGRKRHIEMNIPKSPEPVSTPPRNRRDCSSIKQVLASTDSPRKFYVRAQVLDFYPFRLDDSFIRSCTNCTRPINDKRLACVECNDFEHAYVKIICVSRILVKDEVGDELKLSISGDVPLLDGLERVVMRDDPDAARRFHERLKPLIGNIVDVHEGMLRKEVIEPSGPMLTLTVDNWKTEDGSVVYGLQDYEP
ncbi:hypothetical protein B0H10DRAFT_2028043 [Mycena sp. CBHHK59/15]|nr:hypothetical protein B0H10DRAFT_2028043 [Mycena sp. CBHHK59/15]